MRKSERRQLFLLFAGIVILFLMWWFFKSYSSPKNPLLGVWTGPRPVYVPDRSTPLPSHIKLEFKRNMKGEMWINDTSFVKFHYELKTPADGEEVAGRILSDNPQIVFDVQFVLIDVLNDLILKDFGSTRNGKVDVGLTRSSQ